MHLYLCDMRQQSNEGGTAIFICLVCLVYLVRPVFLVNKIQFVFLFICLCVEIDGIDKKDEIDLINGSEDGRGRAWTGPILSNLIIATGKKMLPNGLEVLTKT
jgi:hypothetical protein